VNRWVNTHLSYFLSNVEVKKLKNKTLIEKLQGFDPELEVEVMTTEDSEKILAVYPANLYQGREIPSRKVICLDIVPEEE
jgi:hypothetical protein